MTSSRMIPANQIIGPDLAMVLWTVGALASVGLIATAIVRWRLGRSAAIPPWLAAALFVAITTVIWVYPGIVAALIVGAVASVRRLTILTRQR